MESYLWKGFQEVVSGMNGPVSLQVSPIDGRFLYVASDLSQRITIYSRQNGSGTIQYLQDQVFVPGLQQIAISPDQRNLYASVYLPGSVVVFGIDNATGLLVEIQRLSNSADWESGPGFIEGLAGASGLSVSGDGLSVYVAGYLEDAMVAFNRNSSGHLAFSDRILNGERSIVSFHDVVNVQARLDDGLEPDASQFPRQLPTNNAGASFPARRSIPFR
eukprot:218589-Rhodomonas_salina.1